jgi:hypothetical protein
VAVFTDLEAGDRWLDDHLDSIDLVFVLTDGQPRSTPDSAIPAEYLARHHASASANGQSRPKRLSDEIGHILLYSSSEQLDDVYEILDRWRHLPTEQQNELLKRMLVLARRWPA